MNQSASDDPLPDVIARLQSLRGMADGWDSYGALAPSDSVIDRAIAFAKQILSGNPHVCPTVNGNICFEGKDGTVVEIGLTAGDDEIWINADQPSQRKVMSEKSSLKPEASCSVADWDEVWQVLEAINEAPSDVRFLDGTEMTGPEGWRAAVLRVRSKLAELRARSPKNLMVCKQLPWLCGECGTESVKTLTLVDNGDVVATCDRCGTEWV